MKIDKKYWRRYEVLKYFLDIKDVWKSKCDHHYLSADQIEEILDELKKECQKEYKKQMFLDNIKQATKY